MSCSRSVIFVHVLRNQLTMFLNGLIYHLVNIRNLSPISGNWAHIGKLVVNQNVLFILSSRSRDKKPSSIDLFTPYQSDSTVISMRFSTSMLLTAYSRTDGLNSTDQRCSLGTLMRFYNRSRYWTGRRIGTSLFYRSHDCIYPPVSRWYWSRYCRCCWWWW